MKSFQNIFGKIDSLKSEVDSLRPLKPEQENRLLQKVRLDWNYHSNHIEGNSLTYGETKALLLWGITAEGKPLRDHLEIKGHNEAVEYIMEILKGREIILTEYFIREFHKIIIPEEYYLEAKTPDGLSVKRKITPGEYKKNPNHVETPTGEIFYFASPEETPAKMMDLMTWYKKETDENKSHPLVIATMFHYQFVRIHPFDDGNGRMSRLLINLILMKYGYPPVIIQTKRREDYINSLQYADSQDFDKFIDFIGDCLTESLELWLKAAKGEPIEEYDDIDKMVRLLEKKANGIEDKNSVKLKLEFETFKNIFEKSVNPLFELLFKKLKLFEDFFLNYKIYYNFGKNDNELNYQKDDYNNFLTLYHNKSSSNKLFNFLEIYFNFQGFKKSGISPFNIGVRISVTFNEFNYKISSATFHTLNITKLYHQNLTEEEINTIAYELGKHLHDELNKQIDSII